MKFLFALSVVGAFLPSVFAECCSLTTGDCGDGTKGTPCCGKGKCNVFCCACAGGCRGKRLAQSDVLTAAFDTEATTQAFEVADKGNKGHVTLDEYLEHMQAGVNRQQWVDWFELHDNNKDGKLSIDEVFRE